MKLKNNNHSVFSLNYHLVLVIKYRRKIINDDISCRMREIFDRVASKYNIFTIEWNHDMDHIHVLFDATPNSDLSKFISVYKSASSRIIKKEYPGIRQYLWSKYLWSGSFCLISTGGATIDIIKQYICSQGY